MISARKKQSEGSRWGGAVAKKTVAKKTVAGESTGMIRTVAHNIEKQAYVLKYDTNKCPASSHKIHVPLIP